MIQVNYPYYNVFNFEKKKFFSKFSVFLRGYIIIFCEGQKITFFSINASQ